MPRPLERGGMRGLAFRASSPFPFFVTCRGGIRIRRTSHGVPPLNCKAMLVVATSEAKLTRPRSGRLLLALRQATVCQALGTAGGLSGIKAVAFGLFGFGTLCETCCVSGQVRQKVVVSANCLLLATDSKTLFRLDQQYRPTQQLRAFGTVGQRTGRSIFPLVTQRGFTCRWL